GAVLREADMEGANLQLAKLFGAELRGAKLAMADMSGALIWRTVPPAAENVAFADMANMVMNAPSAEDIGQAKSVVAALDMGPIKVRLTSLMAPLHDAGANGTWGASADGQAWTTLAK